MTFKSPKIQNCISSFFKSTYLFHFLFEKQKIFQKLIPFPNACNNQCWDRPAVHLSLSHRWQGLKHLGHDLLPPRVCVKEIWTWNIKRKLYESRIARDETRDSVRWDMGIRPKHLLRCPKICPCTLSLKTPVWSSTLDAALGPKI